MTRPISSSLRKVSTCPFREEIARSKKTPALQTTLQATVETMLACVASVSVRFRRKELETRVKDREKSGASKRPGRGWGRKEGKGRLLPSPPPPPSFTFWFSFHFSRGQNRKSPSLVFLCPETKRKRLPHRLYPVLHSNFIVFFCLFCLLVAIWH